MEYYVYEYYIIETDEVFYVGKGKGNRAYIGRRNKFCESMKKSHNWDIRIIKDRMTEVDAYTKEIELIKYYKENTTYRLTNQTDGGDGTNGWVATEEFKEKQRLISLARWKNPDYRNNLLSKLKDENGSYKSNEFRDKISKLVKGENNPNYGNRWSENQRKHLSNTRKESGIARGMLNPNSKKVMCVETGEIFEFMQKIMEKYPTKSYTSYSKAVDKKTKTASGYHWITINDTVPTNEERFKYLLECLIEDETQLSYICVETKEIFKTRKEIMLHFKCGVKKAKQILENKLYNGYEYITIKEYYGRIY